MTIQSDPVTETSKKHKYILVTHGDSYVGYTAAIYIADQLVKFRSDKKHWKVKVLCKDKRKLIDLEKRGIEVQEIDYTSTHMVMEQMKAKIRVMLFNPFSDRNDIMEQGKNLLECAIKNKIKRIAMVSMDGCQLSRDMGPLRDYHKLEEHLKQEQKFGYWTILRVPFIQQFFYFWASMVQNGILGLPLSKKDMLYDANIQDICDCLAQVTLSKKHNIWSSTATKRVYELRSGPLTFEAVVATLSNALKEIDGTPRIHPITLTDDQFKRYLEYVSSENSNLLQELLKEICDDDKSIRFATLSVWKSNVSSEQGDNPHFIPRPSDVITPFFVHLMMDYMKMIRGNQPLSVIPNEDIRDLTGNDPIHVKNFFTSNLRRFRPD